LLKTEFLVHGKLTLNLLLALLFGSVDAKDCRVEEIMDN
jgi:hypothetical protein